MIAAGSPNRLRAWLPVLALAAVIWVLGGEGFSHPQTSRILGPLLEWLLPGLAEGERAELMFFIRKLAHPAEYGLLALLAFRAASMMTDSSTPVLIAKALFPVVVLACADEARQAFSATRTGSAWDVALDVSGGGVAIALVLALGAWRGRPLFSRPAERLS